MRNSLILFTLLSLCIWGCASGEDDKFDKITKEDKRMVKKICKCVAPLMPYVTKLMNATDSATAVMYADSLQIKSIGLDTCIGDAKILESKAFSDEKYSKLFIEYIKEKHPDCVPLFLGREGFTKEKIKDK